MVGNLGFLIELDHSLFYVTCCVPTIGSFMLRIGSGC